MEKFSFLHDFNMLAVALLLVLVSGCAGNINYLSPLPEKNSAPLDQNHGIVVAKIINASLSKPFNELIITPENINESKDAKFQLLNSIRPLSDGSTVFASATPGGAYTLGAIGFRHVQDDLIYYQTIPVGKASGTFEVKPGEVTDLGSLVFYQKHLGDENIGMLIRVPDEPSNVLSTYFPSYKTPDTHIYRWNKDEFDGEREKLYLTASQHPTIFDGRYKSPDGSIYFLAKLGVILKRDSSGRWSQDTVNTNSGLTAISQNNKGDIAVGGLDGRFFYKMAKGSWVDLSMPSEFQIDYINFTGENSLDVIANSSDTIRILRGNKVNGSIEWDELNRYTSDHGWSHSRSGARQDASTASSPAGSNRWKDSIKKVNVSKVGDNRYISIDFVSHGDTRFFAPTNTEAFELTDQDWVTLPDQELPDITSVFIHDGVKLGRKGKHAIIFNYGANLYRYDSDSDLWKILKSRVTPCVDGKWPDEDGCEGPGEEASQNLIDQTVTNIKQLSSPFGFNSLPLFKNEKEAIASVDFRELGTYGAPLKESRLLFTKDGGMSWYVTDASLPKEYCKDLISEVTDRLLVGCNGTTGEFYESFDEGMSWTLVHENSGFPIKPN